MSSRRWYGFTNLLRWLVIAIICGSALISLPKEVKASSTTLHVAPSGSDIASCGTETQPCKTIQYAVNMAETGDTILVAEGVYTFEPKHDVCTGRIASYTAVVCYIDKELTIRGGFTTNNWSSSDPDNNPTIIDGQGTLRGVRLQKSYQEAPLASLHMEGFTIRNGYAGADSGDTHVFGGGLLSEHASVTLRNVVFVNNEVHGSSTCPGGRGAGAGGGAAVNTTWGNTTAILEDVIFENNRAIGGDGGERGGSGIGGGLFTYGITFIGKSLTFTNNQALAGSTQTGDGEAGYEKADAQGGAAAFHGGTNAELENIVVTDNLAKGGNAPAGEGGGAFGGGIFVEDSTIELVNVDIFHNQALAGNGRNNGTMASQAWGGGITTMNSNAMLSRVKVIDNESRGGDGQVYSGAVAGGGGAFVAIRPDRRSINIINSVFAGNFADDGAGSIVGGGGGGLWLFGVDADITHSTFAHNTIGPNLLGQGIILVFYTTAQPTYADIRYSIISDHTANNSHALFAQAGTAVNLVQGLYANNAINDNHDFVGPKGFYYGVSSMFQASSAGYLSSGAPDYDYHIRKDSPARDRITLNNINVDFDQDSREMKADIGADEYVSPLSLTMSPLSTDSLRVTWKDDNSRLLTSSGDHYHLNLECEAGAAAPPEIECGSHIDLSLSEGPLTLTGLTTYKKYTAFLELVDGNDHVLERSNAVTAFATDQFVYLPMVSANAH